jgi:hypothetical protein
MSKAKVPRQWIATRPSATDPEGYARLLYEVLSYQPALGTITVRGRFGHVFDMEIAHARKYYMPVKQEDDLELAARMQEQLMEAAGVTTTERRRR